MAGAVAGELARCASGEDLTLSRRRRRRVVSAIVALCIAGQGAYLWSLQRTAAQARVVEAYRAWTFRIEGHEQKMLSQWQLLRGMLQSANSSVAEAHLEESAVNAVQVLKLIGVQGFSQWQFADACSAIPASDQVMTADRVLAFQRNIQDARQSGDHERLRTVTETVWSRMIEIAARYQDVLCGAVRSYRLEEHDRVEAMGANWRPRLSEAELDALARPFVSGAE